MDVVSLFTNIPIELVINSINKRWDNISNYTTIPKIEFLNVVKFIFDTTYFLFNKKYYKQILGTPMGATISPIVAQYVMDDLLDECVPKLSFNLPFLKKYVDDLILSIPSDGKDEVLRTFNNYNQHIQFTIESETDNSVPFLDTKLIRNHENKIMLDWYVKPTSSGRYINYNSYHSEKMKINLVLGLKLRIVRISHPTLQQQNLNKLYNILLDNSYPERLLKKIIFNTSTINYQQQNDLQTGTPDISAFLTINQPIYYFSVPAIHTVTNKITKIFKFEPFIKIAFKFKKNIGTLFSRLKDTDEALKKSSVVYSIPCSECDRMYVGQTSRVLKDRITSHKSDCRLKKRTCALAEHSIDTGHVPNFVSTKILHQESNSKKRIFLEMAEIYTQPNTLNKNKDVADLSIIYSNLMSLHNNNTNTSLSITDVE